MTVDARDSEFERTIAPFRNNLEVTMNDPDAIPQFLAGDCFAVVGASRDSSKIGNKVFRAYHQAGRQAFAVNPNATRIGPHEAYPNLAAVPQTVHGVSVITPPEFAESIVQDAASLGIRHIWFQPGAESEAAVAEADAHGMNCISGGPCLLVVLGYREI